MTRTKSTYLALLAVLLAPMAADAEAITVNFRASGFQDNRGDSSAPADSVSGTIVYEAANLLSPIDSIVSVSLSVGSYAYTLNEVGFFNFPDTGGIGGLLNDPNSVTAGTNDFIFSFKLAANTPRLFVYGSPSTPGQIWRTTSFDSFSRTIAATEACSVSVTRYSQGDLGWAGNRLDTSPYNETIGSHGCALTALATAITAAPDSLVDVTPGVLNNIAAFDAEANLDWWATPRRVQGNLKFVGLRFDSDINPAQSMDFLKQGVCDNATPVIVQVPDPTYLKPHFVLVTGIDGDNISIVDPGYANRTSLSAYGNRFKTRGYVQDPPGDISAVSIHVSPDTPFLIVDEFGNRTGIDPTTGEVIQEIPQSAYFVDAIANDVTGEAPFSQSHLAHVFQPYSGSYEIRIYAVNDQDVEIAVFSFSTDGEEQPTNKTNVPVFAGAESTFQLTIDTATGGESTVERLVPVPEGLAARPKSGKVSLTWTLLQDATGYNIYRSESTGGPYDLIAANHVTAYATYLDRTVTNGLTYYYVVTVVIGGIESNRSNEASATPSSRTRR